MKLDCAITSSAVILLHGYAAKANDKVTNCFKCRFIENVLYKRQHFEHSINVCSDIRCKDNSVL